MSLSTETFAEKDTVTYNDFTAFIYAHGLTLDETAFEYDSLCKVGKKPVLKITEARDISEDEDNILLSTLREISAAEVDEEKLRELKKAILSGDTDAGSALMYGLAPFIFACMEPYVRFGKAPFSVLMSEALRSIETTVYRCDVQADIIPFVLWSMTDVIGRAYEKQKDGMTEAFASLVFLCKCAARGKEAAEYIMERCCDDITSGVGFDFMIKVMQGSSEKETLNSLSKKYDMEEFLNVYEKCRPYHTAHEADELIMRFKNALREEKLDSMYAAVAFGDISAKEFDVQYQVLTVPDEELIAQMYSDYDVEEEDDE